MKAISRVLFVATVAVSLTVAIFAPADASVVPPLAAPLLGGALSQSPPDMVLIYGMALPAFIEVSTHPHVPQFWRCGTKFTPTPRVLDVAKLGSGDYDRLVAEKMLVVAEYSGKDGSSKASEPANVQCISISKAAYKAIVKEAGVDKDSKQFTINAKVLAKAAPKNDTPEWATKGDVYLLHNADGYWLAKNKDEAAKLSTPPETEPPKRG